MPKLLFCNFIEIALRRGCSPVNLLHIFGTPFSRNTSGWLLLNSDKPLAQYELQRIKKKGNSDEHLA